MRVLLTFALFAVSGCYDAAATLAPRDVCGNGLDDDGDGHIDGDDQDCWRDAGADVDGGVAVADSGPAPAVDAGIVPVIDGGVAPPASSCAAGTVRARIAWTGGTDLRYAQVQGCWPGGSCIVDRFNGMDGPCSSDTGTVVCRLDRVPVGARVDFNAYGEHADGSTVWGVGLAADGTVYSFGTLFVSEDRNCDNVWDVDRTGAVTIVGIREGGGRNRSLIVGR